MLRNRATSRVISILILLSLAAAGFCHARQSNSVEPKPPLHTIKFDTDEGTWMCVDVSPDGKTLAFDLLGGLYTMPISGGVATPLLTGRAWDSCPRFSPDGKQISFISDRTGMRNVWVLDLATNRIRQITDIQRTSGLQGAFGTPEWLRDGQEIAYGYGTRSGSDIRIVRSTGGDSRVLVPDWKVPGVVSSTNSATFTPDGRTSFFSVLKLPIASSLGPKNEIYQLGPESKSPVWLTESVSGRNEFKPQLSRSGRFLAYARSNGPNDTELRIRDLKNGKDSRLTAIVDSAEPSASDHLFQDEIPAYAFTPDDRYIVIWYAGKLHEVSVADGSSTVIPFRVHAVREVATAVRGHYRIPDGPLQVHAVRWPTVSHDGKTLVFSAVGSLWVSTAAGGEAHRLTQSGDFEFMPALSPDGQSVAYTAFAHDEYSVLGPGRLVVRQIDTGDSRIVMNDNGSYYVPSWSPDGTKLAVVREENSGRTKAVAPGITSFQVPDDKAEFGWVDIGSNSFHAVAPARPFGLGNQSVTAAQHVSFTSDGERLLLQQDEQGGHIVLKSMELDGSGSRNLVSAGPDVLGIFAAPDLSKVVLLGRRNYAAYLQPMAVDGSNPLKVSLDDPAAKKITSGGAIFPCWTDNNRLIYVWTNQIYSYRAGESGGKLLQTVNLQVPRRGGQGVVAYRNARLITVSGEPGAGGVIEHGTIVVRDRRIEAIGPVDRVSIPAGGRVIDASGLTIMPGLVDSHAHLLNVNGENYSPFGIPFGPRKNFDNAFRAGLAYGLTTEWEAHGGPGDGSRARIELLEAGLQLGPRWFAAGGQMNEYGVDYKSFSEVQEAVREKVALGAEQCIKNHGDPDRTVSQWYTEAARDAGICMVSHTSWAADLLSHAADGNMVDHPTLRTPSYRDVVQFLVGTGVIWTSHTILAGSTYSPIAAAGVSFLSEIRDRDDQEQLKKLARYGPNWLEKQKELSVMPYERTASARVASVAAVFQAAGGKIAASVDGGFALNNHFEMWSLSRGGMGPAEAIRAASMTGAQKLGLQDDIGSLEPGKLADLLVLTANPLERIENTLSLKYTVLGGVIYDSNTLEVLDPSKLTTVASLALP